MITNVLIIITSLVIVGFLITNKKIFLFVSIVLISYLFLNQIRQTKITNFLSLTEMETVDQINRMHQYPNYAFRLGHIIEERPESIILTKLDKNFTDTLDYSIFPNAFLTLFLFPFFILGIFKSISHHTLFTLGLIVSTISLFTIIGHQNSPGPLCFYPTIFAYSLYSLVPIKLLNK